MTRPPAWSFLDDFKTSRSGQAASGLSGFRAEPSEELINLLAMVTPVLVSWPKLGTQLFLMEDAGESVDFCNGKGDRFKGIYIYIFFHSAQESIKTK